jgi:hypothetical protein
MLSLADEPPRFQVILGIPQIVIHAIGLPGVLGFALSRFENLFGRQTRGVRAINVVINKIDHHAFVISFGSCHTFPLTIVTGTCPDSALYHSMAASGIRVFPGFTSLTQSGKHGGQ